MNVLIYAETAEGTFKKTALEAIFYGSKVAEKTGGKSIVLAIGPGEQAEMAKAGNYGAEKVLHAQGDQLDTANIAAYAEVLVAAAQKVRPNLS